MPSRTYHQRKRLRRVFLRFLADEKFHFFVTLNTNNPMLPDTLRLLFKDWLARIDHRAFGKMWSTTESRRRTFAVACMEHLDSNAHMHVLVRLPRKLWELSKRKIVDLMELFWETVCISGELHKITINWGSTHRKLRPFIGYTGKKWTNEEAFSQMMISTEFHHAVGRRRRPVNANLKRTKR